MADMLEPRSPLQDMRSMTNGLMFLARVGAVTLEVLLHKNFGVRYFGGQAAAALLVVPLFGTLLFPHDDQRPLLIFLGVFFVACASARAQAARLQRKGCGIHSMYNGWPKCLKLSASGKQELFAKQVREPLAVLVMGLIIYSAFNPPLGAYFMFAAASLAVTNRMYQMWTDRQAMDMQDATINQQLVAERFQELQNGW